MRSDSPVDGQVTKWRAWARARAKAKGDEAHPRVYDEATGRASLVPLTASMEVFEEAVGVIPRLYFDFLRFCIGYFCIGAIIQVRLR